MELLIQPYLRERKRKHECMSGKKRDKKKMKRKKERRIFKDDIRSLEELKTKSIHVKIRGILLG